MMAKIRNMGAPKERIHHQDTKNTKGHEEQKEEKKKKENRN